MSVLPLFPDRCVYFPINPSHNSLNTLLSPLNKTDDNTPHHIARKAITTGSGRQCDDSDEQLTGWSAGRHGETLGALDRSKIGTRARENKPACPFECPRDRLPFDSLSLEGRPIDMIYRSVLLSVVRREAGCPTCLIDRALSSSHAGCLRDRGWSIWSLPVFSEDGINNEGNERVSGTAAID